MSTPKTKITTDRSPFHKITERLKKFIANLIKQGPKTPVESIPVKPATVQSKRVKDTNPKGNQAAKRAAYKKKAAAVRKTKP
jgi:hypothetical protein